jgi:hypothetical protein
MMLLHDYSLSELLITAFSTYFFLSLYLLLLISLPCNELGLTIMIVNPLTLTQSELSFTSLISVALSFLCYSTNPSLWYC